MVVERSFSSCQRVASFEGLIVQEQEQEYIITSPGEGTTCMCWQVILDLQLKIQYHLVKRKMPVCRSPRHRIGALGSPDLPIIYHLELERLGTIHHTNQSYTRRIHKRHFLARTQTPRCCCVVLFWCATRFSSEGHGLIHSPDTSSIRRGRRRTKPCQCHVTRRRLVSCLHVSEYID
jgi:hypothetical protein